MMMTKVGPSKPPLARRTASLVSIQHHDEAVEAETLGAAPMEFNEETKWIRSHIKRRECYKFIEKDSSKPELCHCGYQRREHPDMQMQYHSTEWDTHKNTKNFVTNAFGDIEFVGFGGNIGKYIRVDVDTRMRDMLELMMEVWGMEKPNLLISVTGGAKNFQMSKRLKETFRRGLLKAAQSTGAWIITGGTHAGVMKHVGEAVKDYGLTATSQNPVVAIGIAPWGCIQNKDLLTDKNCEGLWPARYPIDEKSRPKESFLDPNHTHFFLVDNGMQHKYAVEIPFRAQLEKEVSKMRTDTGDNAVSVPIVLLVLEGGPGTMETVHQAIQNNTPAVIVKGSGRAADILAFAYQNAREEEFEVKDREGKVHKKLTLVLDTALEVEVMQMVEKEFGNKEVSLHVGRIKDCLAKCDLMSVYELDGRAESRDIDVAMLKALLKANRDQVMDQLKLALAWNRIDVAKSEIFTDDRRWQTGMLNDVMYTAIQLNRVNFVELFLDHGVSLREFLSKECLISLYNRMRKNSLLRTQLTKMKSRLNMKGKYFSLKAVGHLIQDLVGDYYRANYVTQPEYSEVDADLTLDLFKSKNDNDLRDQRNRTNGRPQVQAYDFQNPYQELFIWAVLNIRQDLAKLFWCEGRDALAAALMANSLLKAMEQRTEDTELAIKIRANAEEWSDLAIGVLSECHSTDEKKAQDLLVRELPHWGETTCMLIAVKADNKEFISQTACQSLLNRIWMGRIAQEHGTLKLMLCMFLPPLAYWLLRYHLGNGEEAKNNVPVDLNQPQNPEDGGKAKLLRRQTTAFNLGGNKNIKNSRSSLQSDADNQEGPLEVATVAVKKMGVARDRFYYFFNAPVIIFLYNVFSYLIFLLLFSYVLIVKLEPTVSEAEIVLIVWVFTIFTEEIRQMSGPPYRQRRKVATTSSHSLRRKIVTYITDTWNVVDMITIGLFVVGMVLRFLPSSDTFEAARVFLALSFVSFFLRLLHIFSVHKELGPKLVMIGRMMQDLMYFVVILMVFVVSYAIASHSILFPNSPLTGDTAISLIRRSYWNIYGELFLEEIDGDADCTFDETLWMNNTHPRCPTEVGRYVVPIMMGIYMLLANVLLLNLLIAMFSYTFQMVQDNTDKHWFYQRYSLIYEYYTRPVLAPPFIFFTHVYLALKYVVGVCCGRCCCFTSQESEDDDFRRKFSNERELVQWENVIADAFHHKKELQALDSTDFQVKSTSHRLETLLYRVDEIQEHQMGAGFPGQQSSSEERSVTPVTPSSITVKMPPEMSKRLTDLEKQMEITLQSMGWVVNSLREQGMGLSVAPPAIPNLKLEKVKEKKRREKKRKEDRAIVNQMMEERQELHYRSRTSPYPNTQIIRATVTDDKVPWEVPDNDYMPPTYTSEDVLAKPAWADKVDLLQLSPQGRSISMTKFNQTDNELGISRISFLGPYQVVKGLPLNPRGRTGLQGRGDLGRWGPNHATDPVVTRWKYEDGKQVMSNGKPVFEFVAVQRSDNRMWALPGAILKPGCKPSDHLRADFTEEALGTLLQEDEAKFIRKQVKKLMKKGTLVYQGYSDDPRNTDNAWIETQAFSFHDNNSNILKHFLLRAGETVEYATWLTASSQLQMHASHSYILKLVADRLGAAL